MVWKLLFVDGMVGKLLFVDGMVGKLLFVDGMVWYNGFECKIRFFEML